MATVVKMKPHNPRVDLKLGKLSKKVKKQGSTKSPSVKLVAAPLSEKDVRDVMYPKFIEEFSSAQTKDLWDIADKFEGKVKKYSKGLQKDRKGGDK